MFNIFPRGPSLYLLVISAIHSHMHACWTKIYLGMDFSLLKESRFIKDNTALKPLCWEVNLYIEKFPLSKCVLKGMKYEKYPELYDHQIFPYVYLLKICSMSNRALSKYIQYYAFWSEVAFTELNYYVAKWKHKNPS